MKSKLVIAAATIAITLGFAVTSDARADTLSIPEPAPAALMALGVAGLGWHAARRRARQWQGDDDFRETRPMSGRDRLAHAERYWLSAEIS